MFGHSWKRWSVVLAASTLVLGLAVIVPAQAVGTGAISGTISVASQDELPDGVLVALEYAQIDGDDTVWIGVDDVRLGAGSDGDYTFSNVDAGKYRVTVTNSDSGAFLGASSAPVDVAGSTVTGVDLSLVVAAMATGTVTGSGGAPLSGISVIWYVFDSGSATWVESDTAATTGPTGEYTLYAAAATTSYRLGFFDPTGRHREAFWNGTPAGADDVTAATTIPVTPGQQIAVDIQLSSEGRISGTVTLPAAIEPDTEDVDVRLWETDGTPGDLRSVVFAPGSRTGTYLFDGVPAGSYLLEFTPTGSETRLAMQFFDGVGESQGWASATPVEVVAGSPTTADVTLEVGGSITGRVVDHDLVPASGCRVVGYRPDGTLGLRSAVTGPDGRFDLGGLSTGSYYVAVEGGHCGRAVRAYYDADVVSRFAADESAADPVAVTIGEQESIDPGIWLDGPDAADLELNEVSIDGQTKVLKTLRATADWLPQTATPSYRWLRNGEPIAGAVESTYRLAPDDLGESISVELTISHPWLGGSSTVTSQPQGPVQEADRLEVRDRPTVAGTATFGSRLTASPGSWSEPDPEVSYQWLRNGQPIDDATDSVYDLTANDVGRRIAVMVAASVEGFAPASDTSDEVGPVSALAFAATSKPRISGENIVGKTLSSTGGTWTVSRPTLARQWLRNGRPISGATGSTYRLVAADRGARLSVRVRASASGYTTAESVSAATAAIRQVTRLSVASTPGKRRATLAVTLKASGLSSSKLTGKVTVSRKGKTLATGKVTKGRAKLKITKQLKGTHTYLVTYRGNSVAGPVTKTVRIRIR